VQNAHKSISLIVVFWFVTPYSLLVVTNLSEESIGSIFRVDLYPDFVRRHTNSPRSHAVLSVQIRLYVVILVD
jgi:hypothetical protein